MPAIMRRLAALLLLAFATAYAAPNTEGLPAGAVAVVGFDVATFRASKVGQAAEKMAGLKIKKPEASRALESQLGVDPSKDLSELIVAIYPGRDGKVSEKNASGIVLLRGRFDPARLDGFARTNQLPGKKVGQHQAWEAGLFLERVSGEKRKDNSQEAYLVAHSAELIVIAGADFLERALESADRREKAAVLPAEAATKFASVPGGWLFLHADATSMKDADKKVGLEHLTLALGEDASVLRLALAAGFSGEDKAALMRKQLAGLQAMATIGLMNQEGKSPEEQENLTMLSDLVQKIRLGGEGRTATLDLEYPADKAALALAKAIEKSQQRPAPLAK